MNEPLVLLVKDREEDVFLFRRALQRAEITLRVEVAKDGQEAIDYLAGTGRFADRKKFPLPALVLLDLKLPLQTGLDVLAWIETQPTLRSLVVIVFSSSIDEGDMDRAYELGANAFLVKPTDLNTLPECAAPSAISGSRIISRRC